MLLLLEEQCHKTGIHRGTRVLTQLLKAEEKRSHGLERHAKRNPIDSGVYSASIAW